MIADDWERTAGEALHVQLVEWASAFIVYPASAHYLARLALGLADTPSLLALQCTRAPIAVAPALPEGSWTSEVMRRHVEALAGRRNVEVITPRPGRAWSTGRDSASVPPPLAQVVRAVARQALQLRDEDEEADPR